MEEFKKKLTRKYRFITAFCCSSLLMYFGLKYLVHCTNDFALELVSGVFSGIMLVSAFNLARIHAALHHEEKLRKMYIQETDERNIEINKETMQTASVTSLMVTAIAVIVSGFLNPVISMTLCISIMVDAVIAVAIRSYYNKKM